MEGTHSIFPSDSGFFTMQVPIKPVSLRASRGEKDVVTEAIRSITRTLDRLLVGDIAVKIAWFINPEERYESDDSADIDNILKPIIDALSGPEGIMVNDCQVQCLTCLWVDRDNAPERIQVDIEYEPDAYLRKDGIMFVQIQGALCMPINGNMPPKAIKAHLDILEAQVKNRDALLKRGVPVEEARWTLSIQRFFHKTRVDGFKVRSIKSLRASIKSGK
jgi:Holliday junction resolvase RusA-like endonuclease